MAFSREDGEGEKAQRHQRLDRRSNGRLPVGEHRWSGTRSPGGLRSGKSEEGDVARIAWWASVVQAQQRNFGAVWLRSAP
jgi:hypothetical protein